MVEGWIWCDVGFIFNRRTNHCSLIGSPQKTTNRDKYIKVDTSENTTVNPNNDEMEEALTYEEALKTPVLAGVNRDVLSNGCGAAMMMHNVPYLEHRGTFVDSIVHV